MRSNSVQIQIQIQTTRRTTHIRARVTCRLLPCITHPFVVSLITGANIIGAKDDQIATGERPAFQLRQRPRQDPCIAVYGLDATPCLSRDA